MKITFTFGADRKTVEAKAVPRPGDVITIVGVVRGTVNEVQSHTFDPQTGEHKIEIDLHT